MAGGKTGALIAAAAEVGAYLGNANGDVQKAMKSFGMNVGIAFQIQDDVLNLVGEEEKYKKEIGGDITEGKRTLAVLHAMAKLGKNDAQELKRIIDSKSSDQKQILKAIELMNRSGSIEYAKSKAKELVVKAKEELKKLPRNASAEKLNMLSDFLIEREY
ncbi:Geranylfarnesyl diphosphate synthase [Candidatus Gugararchaeum adminiculabundum]|nr:Geranylfarnesyl diphosphate synthase [Candidatus Gugararchaeum adminiculabundum]